MEKMSSTTSSKKISTKCLKRKLLQITSIYNYHHNPLEKFVMDFRSFLDQDLMSLNRLLTTKRHGYDVISRFLYSSIQWDSVIEMEISTNMSKKVENKDLSENGNNGNTSKSMLDNILQIFDAYIEIHPPMSVSITMLYFRVLSYCSILSNVLCQSSASLFFTTTSLSDQRENNNKRKIESMIVCKKLKEALLKSLSSHPPLLSISLCDDALYNCTYDHFYDTEDGHGQSYLTEEGENKKNNTLKSTKQFLSTLIWLLPHVLGKKESSLKYKKILNLLINVLSHLSQRGWWELSISTLDQKGRDHTMKIDGNVLHHDKVIIPLFSSSSFFQSTSEAKIINNNKSTSLLSSRGNKRKQPSKNIRKKIHSLQHDVNLDTYDFLNDRDNDDTENNIKKGVAHQSTNSGMTDIVDQDEFHHFHLTTRKPRSTTYNTGDDEIISLRTSILESTIDLIHAITYANSYESKYGLLFQYTLHSILSPLSYCDSSSPKSFEIKSSKENSTKSFSSCVITRLFLLICASFCTSASSIITTTVKSSGKNNNIKKEDGNMTLLKHTQSISSGISFVLDQIWQSYVDLRKELFASFSSEDKNCTVNTNLQKHTASSLLTIKSHYMLRLFTEYVVVSQLNQTPPQIYIRLNVMVDEINQIICDSSFSCGNQHNNNISQKRLMVKQLLRGICYILFYCGKLFVLPTSSSSKYSIDNETKKYIDLFISDLMPRLSSYLQNEKAHFRKIIPPLSFMQEGISSEEQSRIKEIMMILGVEPTVTTDEELGLCQFDSNDDDSDVWPFPHNSSLHHITCENNNSNHSNLIDENSPIICGILNNHTIKQEDLFHHSSNSSFCSNFVNQLKSKMNIVNFNDNNQKKKTGSSSSSSSANGEIHDYIHDDFLLHHIFTFLSLKRLSLTVMGVCKKWQRIVCSTQINFIHWSSAYAKKWEKGKKKKENGDNVSLQESSDAVSQPNYNRMIYMHYMFDTDPTTTNKSPSDPIAIPKSLVSTIDWRKAYIERYQVEKSIKGKYTKDFSWKFQVCNVIGCCAILKSRKQFDTHIQKHFTMEERFKVRKEKEKQKKLKIQEKEEQKKKKAEESKQKKLREAQMKEEREAKEKADESSRKRKQQQAEDKKSKKAKKYIKKGVDVKD